MISFYVYKPKCTEALIGDWCHSYVSFLFSNNPKSYYLRMNNFLLECNLTRVLFAFSCQMVIIHSA